MDNYIENLKKEYELIENQLKELKANGYFLGYFQKELELLTKSSSIQNAITNYVLYGIKFGNAE